MASGSESVKGGKGSKKKAGTGKPSAAKNRRKAKKVDVSLYDI